MSSIPRWLSSRPPSAALEIDARRVTAAILSKQGGLRVLSSYASEPLPAGAVEPALNAVNVHDAAALTTAVRAVLDRLTPTRPRRIALVLPDTVAKFSLLRFEKVPAKAEDLDQLIRWQIRKAAPFKIEDAQIAWIPGVPLPGGGREYFVTVSRRDVIESYEHACVAAGAHPGIVDVASVNLVNAVMAMTGGETGADWLLVHVATDYGTVAVVRGRDVIFFRTRPAARHEDLADLVHQTAMYYEDRLGGGGFSRVVLAGASSLGPEAADRVRRDLEQRVGRAVEPLDFTGVVGLRDRIAAGPDLLDALAPAVGVLLREQVA
jgi:Tfp pilus assembly PilM family ATPase